MRSRLLSFAVFAFAVATGTFAQDRIAVLDTELPKGMDTKVVIPVTEKIMEEFVRSKRFTVLDRSFIKKTLSELEFSTSDLTADDSARIATIGGFIKATYIVVSTVQRLDETYFLSAKMIEVRTGVIMAQSSVDRAGSISVLIGMAGDLGRGLVADALGQPATSGRSSRTAQPTLAPPTPEAVPVASKPARQAKPQGARFSTVSAEIGSGATASNEVGTGYNYYTWVNGDTDAVPGLSYGVSGVFPSGLFYLSAYALDTMAEYDGSAAYVSSDALGFGMGVGLDYPIGPVLTYVGVRGGYMIFMLVTEYSAGGSNSVTWSGMTYGFEFGGDIRIGSYALGLRYVYDIGTLEDEEGAYYDMDAAAGALSLRLGWAY